MMFQKWYMQNTSNNLKLQNRFWTLCNFAWSYLRIKFCKELEVPFEISGKDSLNDKEAEPFELPLVQSLQPVVLRVRQKKTPGRCSMVALKHRTVVVKDCLQVRWIQNFFFCKVAWFRKKHVITIKIFFLKGKIDMELNSVNIEYTSCGFAFVLICLLEDKTDCFVHIHYVHMLEFIMWINILTKLTSGALVATRKALVLPGWS